MESAVSSLVKPKPGHGLARERSNEHPSQFDLGLQPNSRRLSSVRASAAQAWAAS